jgi:predicted XRE-type DNA-binding protein
MSDRAFKSVWDAIEDDPARAVNLKHRSALMMVISEHIKARCLNQSDAAKLFAVSQPRISDLMRGKIEMFSIDTLITMLARAGIGIDIRLRPPRVRTLKARTRQATPKTVRRRGAA